MTDAFMADEDVRDMYNFKASDTFEGSFSAVSLESILFYIVAACYYILECAFDQFKVDIDKMINTMPVASTQWYRQKALEYQHGDMVYWDATTGQVKYLTVDESKRVIKYAAVRDVGTYVQMLVNTADAAGTPQIISEAVMTSFREYIDNIKIAGVLVDVQSLPADVISISAQVTVDRLVINTKGETISDAQPVVIEAVKQYLSSIEYGGIFNKNKLTAAVLAVNGVKDILISSVKYSVNQGNTYKEITGNDHMSVGGAFAAAADISNTIKYI